jgi:hypothetical protein
MKLKEQAYNNSAKHMRISDSKRKQNGYERGGISFSAIS